MPQYPRAVFGAAEGLPNQVVTAIVPSRSGHLWVGTQAGFARFDGARFEVFDSRRVPALRSDIIAFGGLAEDAAGTLWIATYGGDLLRLRAGVETVELVRPTDGASVNGLWVVADTLWMGTTAGLLAVRDGSMSALGTEAGVPPGGVTGLADDATGRVWVATQRGLRRLESGRLVTTAAAELENSPVAVARASDGGIWVSGDRAVLHIATNGTIVERVDVPTAGASLQVLRVDRQGSLWMAGARGLWRMRAGQAEGPFGADHGLPGDVATALAEDAEGNLWVGMRGLVRLRDGLVTAFGRAQGLPVDTTLAVAPGPGDALWVGTGRGPVVIRQGSVLSAPPGDIDGGGVLAIAFDPAGQAWMGVGRRLLHEEGGRLRQVAVSRTPVIALLPDGNDAVWVGTMAGLERFGTRGLEPVGTAGEPLANDRVAALTRGPDGVVWAVGERSGLVRRAGEAFVAVAPGGPPAGSLHAAVLVDADGTAWLGTAGAGLWRLRGDSWTAFGVRQGLAENAVYAVLDDGRGHLWLTGDHGVQRLARAEVEAVAAGTASSLQPVTFGLADGLPALECVGGAGNPAAIDRAGLLWVATERGVGRLDTRQERVEPVPRAVVVGAAADGVATAAEGRRVVGPGMRRLELLFGGVSLSAAERIRLRYRLEGFDRDWVEAGRARVAQYTNLPPGHYHFVAQAALEGGTWSESSEAFAVEVRPALWQRRDSQAAGFATAVAILVVAWRARVRTLHARAAALHAAADEARAEVRTLRGILPVCSWCRKIRDDVGAWQQLEAYVSAHSHAQFSHGICPTCASEHFPAYPLGTPADDGRT